MIFRKAQKSRMQIFEEPHAARKPQFGHPCNIVLTQNFILFLVEHCQNIFYRQNTSKSVSMCFINFGS